ncbi:MAG TPA: hypothetical protein VGO07_00450 [Candidatus Saccharimonadales bacterium]|jgi:hypothetical protein|nr:hypothetical protein [Candidatus Saccharimonadales bacterium]
MDPILLELDFTGGLTEAEMANLAILDAWAKHEAAATSVLNGDGANDGSSLLSKAVMMASELPAGRELVPSVFCQAQVIGGEAVLIAGIRLNSRDLPQEQPAYVALTMVIDETYQSVDEDIISEDEAAKIGQLVIGKVRWAQLRGIELSDDCADIILPIPPLPR